MKRWKLGVLPAFALGILLTFLGCGTIPSLQVAATKLDPQ